MCFLPASLLFGSTLCRGFHGNKDGSSESSLGLYVSGKESRKKMIFKIRAGTLIGSITMERTNRIEFGDPLQLLEPLDEDKLDTHWPPGRLDELTNRSIIFGSAP